MSKYVILVLDIQELWWYTQTKCQKGKIPKFSHAKRGVAAEPNAQITELGSFNFVILWIIMELSVPKLELPVGLQAPVHNWPD